MGSDWLIAQELRDCHDGPLGGHFGRAKTGLLVRRLAFWVGQDRGVAEYVHSRQSCHRTKAARAATPSPASAVETAWDDWFGVGGLDRRAADDGGRRPI